VSDPPTPKSKATQFFEDLCVGVVESVVRAGAKGAESLAADARKVLRREAAKVAKIEDGIKSWRDATVGDLPDSDLPDSLRDDPPEPPKH
jgi:hypothetical protein